MQGLNRDFPDSPLSEKLLRSVGESRAETLRMHVMWVRRRFHGRGLANPDDAVYADGERA